MKSSRNVSLKIKVVISTMISMIILSSQILDSYNCDSSAPLSFPPSSNSSSSGLPLQVNVIDASTGQLLQQPPTKPAFKYMMQRPKEVADILDNAIEELLETIVIENGVVDDGGGGGGGTTESQPLTLAHAG